MNQRVFRGIFFIFLLFLFGCSSGSSSGGGGGDPTGEAMYSGITSQATITGENAAQIVISAFFGGTTNSGMSAPLGAIEGDGLEDAGQSMTVRYLIWPAEKTAAIISGLSEKSVPAAMGAVSTEQINEPGGCGGSMTGTIMIDDETGDVSGSFAYNNYCISLFGSDGITYQGTVDVTGKFDIYTERLNLNCSFRSLTTSCMGRSMTSSGTMGITMSEETMTAEMDTYSRDNATGKTYWCNDYTMVIRYWNDYEEANVSGRYYEPDYGYVDLSTEEPIRIYYYDGFFSRGVIVAEGAANTRARLVILSPQDYVIDADIDGDGSYSLSTGIRSWDAGYLGIELEDKYSDDGSSDNPVEADAFEPDNVLANDVSSNNLISTDGAVQYHTLAPAGDVDTIVFYASSNHYYVIETSGCDTVMWIAYFDAATKDAAMGFDDDSGPGLGSRIEWRCTSSCLAAIAVMHYSEEGTGSYSISVVESPASGAGN